MRNTIKNHFPLLMVFFFLMGSCKTDYKEMHELLLKGNDYYRAGDLQRAKSFFEEALLFDSCFSDAYNNLGIISFDRNELEKAEEYYLSANRCDASFLPAYFNRFNLYYETHQYYSAVVEMERVQKWVQDSSIVYSNLGLVYTRLREYDSALNAFNKALELDTSQYDMYINRATVYYYKNDLNRARKDFMQLISEPEFTAEAYNGLSMVAVLQEQYDSAMVYIDKAINLNPKEGYYINNKGYVYLQTDSLAQALEWINKGIAMDPGNSWSYRNKGIYHLKTSNYKDAERLLLQALRMDPFTENINWYLSVLYKHMGNMEESCTYLNKSKKAHEYLSRQEECNRP